MNGELLFRNFEILLVEDNGGDVLLLRKAFGESLAAAHLNFVTDGEDALAFLNREGRFKDAPPPDIVLLDLNLPRMDGRAVLRRIKGNPRFRSLPVIVLTSSRLESDVRESYEMSANGYLMKPLDLRGYLDTARSLRDFWFIRAVLPPQIKF